MTFFALQIYTFILVFMGSMLRFSQCKNHKSIQISHTGPLSEAQSYALSAEQKLYLHQSNNNKLRKITVLVTLTRIDYNTFYFGSNSVGRLSNQSSGQLRLKKRFWVCFQSRILCRKWFFAAWLLCRAPNQWLFCRGELVLSSCLSEGSGDSAPNGFFFSLVHQLQP